MLHMAMRILMHKASGEQVALRECYRTVQNSGVFSRRDRPVSSGRIRRLTCQLIELDK